MFAPRAALPSPKSDTPDQTDSYPRRMVIWRDALMSQAASELQCYRDFQETERLIDYLDGTYWDANRPAYRSPFYDNYLADQRVEALSALSDVRPQLDISSTIPEYKAQDQIVHKCIRRTWTKNSLDLRLVELLDHSLFGTGFWKMTCYEPGEFDISAHGLDEVNPVGMQSDLQTSTAVIYRTFKPLTYFYAKFGREKCIGLERYATNITNSLKEQYVRPSSIPQYVWNPMSPAMKRRMAMARGPSQDPGLEGHTNPVVTLTEIYYDDWEYNDFGHDILIKNPDLDIREHNYHYIVPPKCRLYPRKRLVIFAGDRVMYDGPSPWWHGLYPYIMLQLNPCVWSPGGISKYRNLIPLVRSINRIGAGIDESIVHALNQTLVSKRGAIDPVSWANYIPGKPGQKLLMNPAGNPQTDLRWATPPQLPAYVEQFLRYLVDDVKRRSGTLDTMGIARKKQIAGSDTLESLRDALSGPFRLESRYVEEALLQSATQAVSGVFQFWTLDRRLKVLGADGQTMEDFDYRQAELTPMSAPREDHWKSFSVTIAPGSAHGSPKRELKQVALLLRRQGDLSRKGLYRILDISEDVDQVEQELMAEQDSGIGPAQKPSKQNPRLTRSSRNGSPI